MSSLLETIGLISDQGLLTEKGEILVLIGINLLVILCSMLIGSISVDTSQYSRVGFYFWKALYGIMIIAITWGFVHGLLCLASGDPLYMEFDPNLWLLLAYGGIFIAELRYILGVMSEPE